MAITGAGLAADAGETTLVAASATEGVAVTINVNPAIVRPPTPPTHGAADYLSALQNLMPRGRVWPRDPTAIQTLVPAALGLPPARVDLAAGGLLTEAFPPTAVQLLGEWEVTLGLPDPCAGPSPTLQARQAQVTQKFVSSGGQSVPFFIALAESLGYAITITEFTGAQAHHWQVNCPQVQTILFRAGRSTAGEPLVSGAATVLECVFNALRPAHSTISFVYG